MKQKMVIAVLVALVVYCNSKSIQNATAGVDETQDERISNVEKSLQILESNFANLNKTVNKGLTQTEHVMFYAIVYSKSISLQIESTIVFEKIILNIGGNYNNYDGVFVAPQKGVYLFSWTISMGSGSYAVTELVVENTVISSTGDTATNGAYGSASMTALCKMNKDDHAFIRTAGYGSTHVFHSSDNYPRTSFLGMLIYSE